MGLLDDLFQFRFIIRWLRPDELVVHFGLVSAQQGHDQSQRHQRLPVHVDVLLGVPACTTQKNRQEDGHHRGVMLVWADVEEQRDEQDAGYRYGPVKRTAVTLEQHVRQGYEHHCARQA